MGTEGSLSSIKGARTKKQNQIKVLETTVQNLLAWNGKLEERMAKLQATLKEVVDSVNASALLLSSVERHLDDQHGEGWDQGVRKEVEARAQLLRERKALMEQIAPVDGKPGDEVRKHHGELAPQIWKVAREAGTRPADAGLVVSLYLQAGDVNAALDVVEEVRRDGVPLPPEVEGMIQKMVDRCAEISREQGNEVGERRATGLVDSSGAPVSSSD